MKLFVLTKSEVPIYVQLHDQIVTQISVGALLPEEKLPSIRVVARELNVSVIPVKAAYDLLEQNGYIYTVQGKGCFVSGKKPHIKNTLAKENLQKSVDYCKKLGLSDEEILQLLQSCLNVDNR